MDATLRSSEPGPRAGRTPDDPTLALVECFYSVQGEGANAGRAAFFIRFAGCNLDCRFADGSVCDTPWRKPNLKLLWSELLNEIYRTIPPGAMVILTGGEPTMAPAFDRIVYDLKSGGWYVAVESNGTRWRESLTRVDWLVVSPKDRIEHGNPLGDPTPDARVLAYAHELRYVVSGMDAPLPEYHRELLPDVMRYVSPALAADGTGMEHTRGETPAFAPGAVDRCLQIVQNDPRWRLSLQTHKWIRVR